MLKYEEIVLELRDAGVEIVGGTPIVDHVAKNLEVLAQEAGVKTGYDLVTLLNAKNEGCAPYSFYVCPHESEEDKMVIYSLDYPEVTMVISNNRTELISVGQEIIYRAHEKLMAEGALIQEPLQQIDQRFPSNVGFTRLAMGDLYALRIFQHNVRVTCARLGIEPSIDMAPDDLIPLH